MLDMLFVLPCVRFCSINHTPKHNCSYRHLHWSQASHLHSPLHLLFTYGNYKFFLRLKVMPFLQSGNPFHESSFFRLSFNASRGC
ncbi:hypothetical protein PFLUV_G00195400 [Perca fluviatilis]|uniref:Uncharacterized protein n=1 Tax=Perca fluviatilis TaxID=8168 RepID=A0A6A5EDF3_PERFL|nr:hypothetical protein PFLUV_G00195400 [Perca fluviatilis]